MRDTHDDEGRQDKSETTESDEVVFSSLDDEDGITVSRMQQKTRHKTRIFHIAEGVVAALIIVGLVSAWFTFATHTRLTTTSVTQNTTPVVQPAQNTTPVVGTILFNQHLQNPTPAWSADGEYLIAVDSQNGVYALNIATNTIRKTFTLPLDPLDSGNWEWSFAPDARYLVVASQKGEIQIWDTIAGRMVLRDNTNAGTWPTWEWSNDSTSRVIISSYNGNGTAQIWNANTGERGVTFHSESLKNIRYFSWSPDGQYIALFTAASSPTQPAINGMVHLWNTGTGKEVQHFSDGGDTGSIIWSPDSTRIATASNKLSKSTTIRIWAAFAGRKILTYTGHSSVPFSLQWSNNVTCILSTSAHETLLWDVNTGSTIIKALQPDIHTLLPSLSPDGNFLAVSTQDNVLQVWSANTGHLLHTYKNNAETINVSIPAVWSPDGIYTCFVTSRGKVQMLSTSPGYLLSIANTLPDMTQSLSWSPANKMLAISSQTTLQVLQSPG